MGVGGAQSARPTPPQCVQVHKSAQPERKQKLPSTTNPAPDEPRAITLQFIYWKPKVALAGYIQFILSYGSTQIPEQLWSTRGLKQHTWNKHPISRRNTEAGGNLTPNQDSVFPNKLLPENQVQKAICWRRLSHACRRPAALWWMTLSDSLISGGPVGKLLRAGPSDPGQRR